MSSQILFINKTFVWGLIFIPNSLVSMEIMLAFSILRIHSSSDDCWYYGKEITPWQSFFDAMLDVTSGSGECICVPAVTILCASGPQ